MKSLTAIALLGLLCLQTTGLDLALAPPSCEQDCPGDGPEGTCAPLCQECTCCPTLRTCVEAEAIIVSPLIAAMASGSESQPLPPRAEPAEIFHIPKPALV